MYPDEGTSKKVLLEAGPSRGSRRWMTRDFDLEDIVVDEAIDVIQEPKLSVAVPKPRPVNLADNYEVIEGVPTFVWKPLAQRDANYRTYAMSSDGTRIAIQEGLQKICVYDVLDNFVRVAEWENSKYRMIGRLKFHNNKNNELVVVFRGSTVALMYISVESEDASRQSETAKQHKGIIEIKQEFCVLENYKELQNVRSYISEHGSETWIWSREYFVESPFWVCSISQQGVKRMKIESNPNLVETFVYCSTSEKAMMLVTLNAAFDRPMKTRVWTELDLAKESSTDSPIEIIGGQSFGFSECGRYFLIYKYLAHSGEALLELHEIKTLSTSSRPIAWRSIGRDVKIVRGQFIQPDQCSLETLGIAWQNELPIIAFVVASSSDARLAIWEPSSNRITKEINLTSKEMKFYDPIHVEFCVSPNGRWLALGIWSEGFFGLYSLLNGSLVWTSNLNTSSRLAHTFLPLKFDVSSTKLFVNACSTLYVFCLPCLLEDYQLEFQSASLVLGKDLEESATLTSIIHQAFLPNHMLKRALVLQHGLERQDQDGVLDMAISSVKSSTALLVLKSGRVTIVQGSFEKIFTSSFKKYIKKNFSKNKLPNEMTEFGIDIPSLLLLSQSLPDQPLARIFMYEENGEDSIVVFVVQDGLLGIFVDVSTKHQDQIRFEDQWCFALKQSKDGNRVFCLNVSSVMIIDLQKRTISSQVTYKANLAKWLVPYVTERNHIGLDVSSNAASILLGYDRRNEKLLFLTSKMDDEECKATYEDIDNIVTCMWANVDLTMVAFLEFDDGNHSVSAVCMYSPKGHGLKKIAKQQWSLHTRRVMELVTQDSMHVCALALDETNGHLWFIALHKIDGAFQFVFTPISPYSLDSCVPSLHSLDYPTRDVIEIEELSSKFGRAFFNVASRGMTNFDIAFRNKDKAMMTKLVDHANQHGISSYDLIAQKFGNQISDDFLHKSIEDDNEAGVAFFFDLMEKRSLSFDNGASMLKDEFERLWLKYGALLERAIMNNSLEWKVCEVEVPMDALSNKVNVETRLGTCNSMIEWDEASKQGNVSTYWKSLHESGLQDIKNRTSNATTSAIVIFFAMSNICKIGFHGIIHFLLMQEAPSCMFKTPLLKWVIVFKWEKVWKRKSVRNFVSYLCFMGTYSVYSIWIAFVGKDLGNDVVASVCLSFLLLILMTIASVMLHQEYIQIQTYINDGKHLFPNDPMWGSRQYFSSVWNVIEVVSGLVLILVIPIFHFTSMLGIDLTSFLFTFAALESILIWIKVWYFAQAFEKTGAFVLMIENIVSDCVPFLSLAFAILVGSSLALFILFQHSLQEKRSDEGPEEGDEIKAMIEQCFGDPLKAMVTMFYAMIGTFEPQVYYHSGSLSFIITLGFIVYLATEMVVMVNMLIAIMGDTFDRVKSTEEEQLLMGRARFIDACEAQLKKSQIEEIERSVGKYLYVLLPKEGDMTQDMRMWQGRVKTIEDKVGKMIMECQSSIMKKLEEEKKEMKGNMDMMIGSLDKIAKIKDDTDNIKDILLAFGDEDVD